MLAGEQQLLDEYVAEVMAVLPEERDPMVELDRMSRFSLARRELKWGWAW